MVEMDFTVREFDPARDSKAVEQVERMCDVGSSGSGKLSLFTDLLGDPICRVRNSPAFLMLVAEVAGDDGEESEESVDGERNGNGSGRIVGLIRGCIKTVTCGTKAPRNGKPPTPLYTKAAYILGLRVSPGYRRRGIGFELVNRLESWFRQMGAEYSYMATEKDNDASVGLFTGRCGYSEFRTPSILVQPVFAHRLPTPSRVTTLRIPVADAEALYRSRFATTEFFPRDIDSVLNNPLCLGTYVAIYRDKKGGNSSWPGSDVFLADPPESWAVLSVWNCKDVYRLEVRGASPVRRALAGATRVFDRAFPWLRIPSVPNIFRPFGFYFLFGLGGEGPRSGDLIRSLCHHAHNMARKGQCGVVAAELARVDPLRTSVPRWKRLSCDEDLWCIKRLGEDYSDGAVGDWTKSEPGASIFVDPREV